MYCILSTNKYNSSSPYRDCYLHIFIKHIPSLHIPFSRLNPLLSQFSSISSYLQEHFPLPFPLSTFYSPFLYTLSTYLSPLLYADHTIFSLLSLSLPLSYLLPSPNQIHTLHYPHNFTMEILPSACSTILSLSPSPPFTMHTLPLLPLPCSLSPCFTMLSLSLLYHALSLSPSLTIHTLPLLPLPRSLSPLSGYLATLSSSLSIADAMKSPLLWLSCVAVCSIAFYVPGMAPRSFKRDEIVEIKVSS